MAGGEKINGKRGQCQLKTCPHSSLGDALAAVHFRPGRGQLRYRAAASLQDRGRADPAGRAEVAEVDLAEKRINELNRLLRSRRKVRKDFWFFIESGRTIRQNNRPSGHT